MEYSEEFKEAVNFCKKNNLFLGHGNPNSKILLVGKEQYYDAISKLDSDEFYDELLKKREDVNKLNIFSWLDNLDKNFVPEWNSSIDSEIINQNALTAHWNQKNKPNRFSQKKNEWNFGTSNTYLHYQKIYQNVFNNSIKQENLNFQKEFFTTELNDLIAKRDYKFKRLKILKKEFISKRQELFDHSFFKSFPVILVASGHYTKDFNFDIEKIFDVDFIEIRETKIKKAWYNVHYSKDGKRLLIHTRQLSTSVPSELIDDLGNIIKKHLIENALP
jgi:hypothetical protein